MRLFPKEEINGAGTCPTYLIRWTLLRLGDFAIYLHHFVGDDWSRELHDHPKRFISIGLKGSYREVLPAGEPFVGTQIRDYHAPWIRSFPATHRHRLIARDCWTLVIVGRKVREWGFWHTTWEPLQERRGSWLKETFIPWRDYVSDKELTERVKSCA